MAAALAPLRHVGTARRVEEQHRFGGERTALGGAERERVDARLPGRLRRRCVHARQRIGEPRAVDMDRKPVRMRDVGERLDFLGPIDGAGLGRLRQRQHRRADVVRAAPLRLRERASSVAGAILPAVAREADELDPAAEEFRRAAFVGRDVRLGMAEDGAPGRRQMRERERIRGGAGRHQEDRDLVLEHLGESRSTRLVQASPP